jgi:hypothetical protein
VALVKSNGDAAAFLAFCCHFVVVVMAMWLSMLGKFEGKSSR